MKPPMGWRRIERGTARVHSCVVSRRGCGGNRNFRERTARPDFFFLLSRNGKSIQFARKGRTEVNLSCVPSSKISALPSLFSAAASISRHHIWKSGSSPIPISRSLLAYGSMVNVESIRSDVRFFIARWSALASSCHCSIC